MSDPIELLDNCELEVQDVTPWDVAVIKGGSLQGCVQVREGKYGIPNNDALQGLLVSIMDQPGEDFLLLVPEGCSSMMSRSNSRHHTRP